MATTTGQSLNMGPYEKNVGGALSFWGCQVNYSSLHHGSLSG